MAAFRRAAYALGMAVRESGQALHRAGCRMQGDYRFTEQRMFIWLGVGGERPGAVAWLAQRAPRALMHQLSPDLYCVQPLQGLASSLA